MIGTVQGPPLDTTWASISVHILARITSTWSNLQIAKGRRTVINSRLIVISQHTSAGRPISRRLLFLGLPQWYSCFFFLMWPPLCASWDLGAVVEVVPGVAALYLYRSRCSLDHPEDPDVDLVTWHHCSGLVVLWFWYSCTILLIYNLMYGS
ncbi:hypothetical protein DPEC_G00254570 [Dallia pectoralis]|uniref:Uncharacterized protein n=1 Tax=Dallia pectoralis TaxID=75939 RepID=A0ACC2FUL5_DALPE|nr:hypothetical protein DPEC_G00254570 [Dallia pectoralis]